MQKITCQLTIYFEGAFWVGTYQRQEHKSLSACKIIFGAQPKDNEVYDFMLKNWHKFKFSAPVADGEKPTPIRNPKRMHRAIEKSLRQQNTVGTKAQQALQQQYEQRKQQVRDQKRQDLQLYKEQQYALKNQKRKKKHRGR